MNAHAAQGQVNAQTLATLRHEAADARRLQAIEQHVAAQALEETNNTRRTYEDMLRLANESRRQSQIIESESEARILNGDQRYNNLCREAIQQRVSLQQEAEANEERLVRRMEQFERNLRHQATQHAYTLQRNADERVMPLQEEVRAQAATIDQLHDQLQFSQQNGTTCAANRPTSHGTPSSSLSASSHAEEHPMQTNNNGDRTLNTLGSDEATDGRPPVRTELPATERIYIGKTAMTKEADTVKLQPLPRAMHLRRWNNSARTDIAGASGNPPLAYTWLCKVGNRHRYRGFGGQ